MQTEWKQQTEFRPDLTQTNEKSDTLDTCNVGIPLRPELPTNPTNW